MQATPGEVPTEQRWAVGFVYYQPVKEGNYYAYPLPWMPVMECSTYKVDTLARISLPNAALRV